MPGPNSGDTQRGRTAEVRGSAAEGSGEFATIARLADRLSARGRGPGPGEVWIGDDAAVLRPEQGWMLLTTDLVVAGVHGDLAVIDVADLGWRAMVASVSDVAAMGGRPAHAVVSVAATGGADVEGLYEGVAAASEEYDCPVVGGDLSALGDAGDGPPIVVSVAMTGGVEDGPGPVLRSGARPGDTLVVTGPLGGSAAGLRALRSGRPGPLGDAHRRPRARVAEGDAARRAGAGAMVDLSDGLAGDLGRLADASGVGFELTGVPVAPGATTADALGGGEDYELVVATARPDALAEHFAAVGLRPPLVIGACVADRSRRTLEGRPLPPGGWEHSFAPGR